MKKIWIIPAKGKGYEVTARNIALGEETEIARPLTTDEMDNVLLDIKDGETDTDI